MTELYDLLHAIVNYFFWHDVVRQGKQAVLQAALRTGRNPVEEEARWEREARRMVARTLKR